LNPGPSGLATSIAAAAVAVDEMHLMRSVASAAQVASAALTLPTPQCTSSTPPGIGRLDNSLANATITTITLKISRSEAHARTARLPAQRA
jgi:hypothetical protein